MGGAGYIFVGDNDANVMHNSALINLNTAQSVLKNVKKFYHLLLVCIQHITNRSR